MSIKRWKLGLKRCNCVKCESAITFEQTEENCGWVMWEHHKEEVALLKAEVERLRASSFVTAVPIEQYERVIKAGSEMSAEMRFAWLERIRTNKEQREAWLKKVHQCLIDWEAAKEGKQP